MAETFDRDVKDIFAVQDDISQTIARRLKETDFRTSWQAAC